MQGTHPFTQAVMRPQARRVNTRVVARENLIVGVLLLVIMLTGGYFRFVGLNWDDFTHLHPDERFLTDVAQGLGRWLNPSGDPVRREAQIAECTRRYPETNGVGGYFDTLCSTLNPLNANSAHGLYVYGTLPLFIARGASEVYGDVAEWYALNVARLDRYDGSFWSSYDGVHLVWRIMSALAEMSCIVFAFAIGLRLHGKWVGVLAAFLYAAAVFSIQIGHFGTVDAIANFFATLTVLCAVQIQRTGKLWHYILFGFAFGCALASRINLLPLFGLGMVAAVVRIYPLFAVHTPLRERDRTVTGQLGGLLLAGGIAVLCFRVFNPYAFEGPGFFDLFNFSNNAPFLHDRWMSNMGTAQALVSGAIDSPPNFQWVGRTPYLYPLSNMVLWGMGAPLGIAAWLALGWAVWRLVRGKPGGLLNIVLLVWVIGYFGYLGRQWVTTMRYFLPLYPALAVLAAWALVGAWEWVRARPRLVQVGVRTLVVAVPALTLLWAVMFTNIYRNLLTRVAASHWVIEHVPGDFAMRVEGAPEGTPLININIGHRDTEEPLETRVTTFDPVFQPRAAYQFNAPASGAITHIHAPHLGDGAAEPGENTLRFSLFRLPEFTPIFSFEWTSALPRDRHPVGDAYDIPLPEAISVERGERYEFVVELVQGTRVLSGGSIVTWEGAWDDPVPTGVCRLPFGVTVADNPPPGIHWDARECSRISPWGAQINGYKPNLVYEDEPIKRVTLLEAMQYSDYWVISSNRFYDQLARNPQRWPMTTLFYERLFAGELGYDIEVMFQQTFELGPLRISDQHLPIYDSPEWLQEFEAEEAFHVYDHPVVFIFRKRADYDHDVVLETLYSVPLTRVNSAPIFRNCPGSDKYFCDPTLVGPAPISSELAAQSPTRLMFSAERLEMQYSGGTWSDRFDAESPVSTDMFVSIAAFWGATLLFGWVVFPALYALTPGLALRGYGYAKFAGMFVIGWGLWVLASLRLPVWSQAGIAAGLLVMAVISLVLVWRDRAGFGAWLRANAGRLLAVEVITLVLFLAYVGVRLTNPDLWHPAYGGEKPMDFAYMNGVLRSTIFPPIDPWHAGGFLNYYYFGYVIVGTPVLLLKMVPSVAYNLLVPLMFALTGIAAYSAAYDIVAALRRAGGRWRVRANPALAGAAALLMAVVLGNLDTPRVFLNGLARMGGYSQPQGMAQFLISEHAAQHGVQPDEMALNEIFARVRQPSLFDSLRYELGVTVELVRSIAGGVGVLANGGQLSIGAERWFWGPSRVLAETPGVGGGAITEMPNFTFVYGDLHAHMIAMPMQFLVIGLVFNEIVLAGRRYIRRRPESEDAEALDDADAPPERSLLLSALAVMFAGVTVGMLRATNTWDWITYLLLGTVGMGLAWWLAQGRRIAASAEVVRPGARYTRASLLALAGTAGGFLVSSFIGVLPYTTYYAAIYNSIRPWTDGKTPLWAYFDIHGLFLFLIITLLVWETGRWLRAERVAALRGRGLLLLFGALVVLLALSGSVVLAAREWQVTLVALPLMLWAGILLLRPGQSRAMQFVLLLTGLGLGLTLGVEYVVLDGDIGRQNTVFKFYIQAWLIFSVVGGAVFAWVVASLPAWAGRLNAVWTTLCAVLVFIAALFPIMATQGKAVLRFDRNLPISLDGMLYMTTARHYEGEPAIIDAAPELAFFPLEEDYRLIRWMQQNLTGHPVIMEGLGSDTQYRWNGRIAIYTGNPAVIGWNFHQRQQRTLEPMGRMVESRNANVNAFYQMTGIGMAWEMIAWYNVEYIVVGRMEHAYYAPEGLAKFDEMVDLGLLDIVYEDGKTRLYRVNQGARLEEFG